MISTSFKEAPSFFVSVQALVYVRSVVPKQGMVTAVISDGDRPSREKAREVTSSASVESRPPEIPMTALLQPVCSSRFFRPMAWMVKISSQRFRRSSCRDGTKGAGSMNRSSSRSRRGREKGIRT